MSNQLEKFGLRPYRKLDGTPLAGAQNRYTIAAGYATAVIVWHLSSLAIFAPWPCNVRILALQCAAACATAIVVWHLSLAMFAP